jgi:nitroimidazol reductase NimA-like FMN-containing flavoprotein (pyridoxamine 5'-phosphate oxidase superfamily)
MPGLTPAEVDEYLAAPRRLVRIGSVGADQTPLVVPTWFAVENGVFLFTPRARSRWFANLRTNPLVCCTVDGDGYQVIIQGTCRTIHDLGQDDDWRDLYRRITLRYLPDEAADAYLTDTKNEPRALLGVDLAHAKITTWRFPSREGEDWLDVWAPRYYHEGHPRSRPSR